MRCGIAYLTVRRRFSSFSSSEVHFSNLSQLTRGHLKSDPSVPRLVISSVITLVTKADSLKGYFVHAKIESATPLFRMTQVVFDELPDRVRPRLQKRPVFGYIPPGERLALTLFVVQSFV